MMFIRTTRQTLSVHPDSWRPVVHPDTIRSGFVYSEACLSDGAHPDSWGTTFVHPDSRWTDVHPDTWPRNVARLRATFFVVRQHAVSAMLLLVWRTRLSGELAGSGIGSVDPPGSWFLVWIWALHMLPFPLEEQVPVRPWCSNWTSLFVLVWLYLFPIF